jgi:hypothetical protein
LSTLLAPLIGAAPAAAAELMMVERDGCPYCDRWQRQIGPIYGKTDEGARAPLRIVKLEDGQPKIKLSTPVRFTPTFLLVDEGREVGRITGYMNDESFWGLLGMLLTRLGAAGSEGEQGAGH